MVQGMAKICCDRLHRCLLREEDTFFWHVQQSGFRRQAASDHARRTRPTEMVPSSDPQHYVLVPPREATIFQTTLVSIPFRARKRAMEGMRVRTFWRNLEQMKERRLQHIGTEVFLIQTAIIADDFLRCPIEIQSPLSPTAIARSTLADPPRQHVFRSACTADDSLARNVVENKHKREREKM